MSSVFLKLSDCREVAVYIHKCYLSVESGRETLHELQLMKVSHYFSKSLKYNSMVNLTLNVPIPDKVKKLS